MTVPPSPDTELLDRYLANDCTSDERAVVDAWVTASESTLRMATLQRAVAEPFGAVAFSTFAAMRRRLWRAAKSAEREQRAPLRMIASMPRSRSRWTMVTAVAAGILVLVAGWRWDVLGLSGGRAARGVAVSTYRTGEGQQANITLPDGNTVVLDVASTLTVPADYASGHHTVHLSGEALFTVAHREHVPFTVVTGSAAAQVLGTSFMVRRYATDTVATIGVRTGRVVVRALKATRVVAAGQQVQVVRDAVAPVHPAGTSLFSFAAGVLTLEGVPLPQAIPELDRWYGVDIRLGDPSLAARRIMGRLPAGSLTDLTALLQLTYNVRVVRNERVLTLFPR